MAWAKHITAVKARYDLGATPAAVNRVTGVLFINPAIYNRLTKEEKKFVIAHEMAHLEGEFLEEEPTDALASVNHFKNGGSLKASVYALAKVLPEGHPRIEMQLLRAEIYDKLHNKRKKQP